MREPRPRDGHDDAGTRQGAAARDSHAVEELTTRIEVVMKPFRGARDLMVAIPGISVGVADVIIAETGADMSRFPGSGVGFRLAT